MSDMKKTIILLLFFCFTPLAGCISKTQYNDALFKAEQSSAALSQSRQDNDKLKEEIKNLEYRNEYLNTTIQGYEESIKTLDDFIKSSKKIQAKAIVEVVELRQQMREKLDVKDLEMRALKEQNDKLKEALEAQQTEKAKNDVLPK